MSIKMDQHITIEQRQELVMTPELIQSIKILKYNLVELDGYVKEQLKDNPVLEQETPSWEVQLKNSYKEDRGPDYNMGKNSDDNNYSFENFVTKEETLDEHLMMQLEISTKSKIVLKIGEYLIQSLDENGYLKIKLKSVAEDLGADLEVVKKTLALIQTFDPYGVGARSLAECLFIQLRQVGMLDNNYIELLKHHMDDFSANKLKKISAEMELPMEEVQRMADVLRHLDPKPGKQYNVDDEKQYIVPEILVEEANGKYTAVFQDESSPRLMISSYYESVLAECREDPEVIKYIKSRIESANRLISSIERRKQTIKKVAEAIVEYQQDFFKKGEKNIKPLTLKMIAEKINMHESTVSRTVTGKYLQCKAGVYELKYFFSAGIKTGGPDKSLSSNSIKAYIKEIISHEDPKHPESDQKLTDILNGSGIGISRRTVTKYREAMNIPSSSMRKRF